MATVKIPLNDYKYALIDEVDIPFINHYRWRAASRRGVWYVQTTQYDQGTPRTLYLARLIMNAHNGEEVDHIDHNPLNNTRENLRLCTQEQNNRNTRPRKTKKSESIFKGVYPQGGKWCAQITVNSQHVYLGRHATEEDAARVYDEAAKMHYGEFAYLNFPEGG